MTQDEQHLNILSVFHYIVGGLVILFSCIFLIYVGVGLVFLLGEFETRDVPLTFLGWFFLFFGLSLILAGWTLAILMFINARKLKQRKSWMFCMVIAGIECIFTPFGTILGVLTIIVLMRDSVKALFAANK
ncbi:MAG: hypothetical protein N3A72_05620 [bacterium]|nr:hypothetical protein [bacterium]